MKLPLAALQTALYSALADISCPVYDQVPEKASYPYVTLGEDTNLDWSTKNTRGHETTHTLHVWSEYEGMDEVKSIMDEVARAITGAPLILGDFAVASAKLEFSTAMRDPDGKTRHGVLRFRFLIEEV